LRQWNKATPETSRTAIGSAIESRQRLGEPVAPALKWTNQESPYTAMGSGWH